MASLAWWRSCLDLVIFSASFGLVNSCTTDVVFWFGHDYFFSIGVPGCLLWYILRKSGSTRGWFLCYKTECLQVLSCYVSLDVGMMTRRKWFFFLVCFKNNWETICTSLLWATVNVLFRSWLFCTSVNVLFWSQIFSSNGNLMIVVSFQWQKHDLLVEMW